MPRFTQPDTLIPNPTNPTDFNRYSYVGNNPVNYNDPTGHCVFGAPCPVDEILDAAGDGLGAAGDLATDVGEFVVDGAQTVAAGAAAGSDRGTTYGAYQGNAWWRRARDPGQFLKDGLSGTFLVEELGAAYAVGVKNADLYWEGDLCGEQGSCFKGVDGLPSGGVTLGHTVLFRDEAPSAGLIGHEFQHVFDIETFGSLSFYPTYGLEDAVRSQTVGGDNFWDARAYNTGGRNQNFRDPTHFGDDVGFDVRSFGVWLGSWFAG